MLNYLYSGGTVDGWVLPEQPAITFAAGRQAHVPVLTGSNADEGTVTLGVLGRTTLASYRAWLNTQFDGYADEVFRAYPAKTDAEVRTAYLAVTADYQRAKLFGPWRGTSFARDNAPICTISVIHPKEPKRAKGWAHFMDWIYPSPVADSFARADGASRMRRT